VLVFVGRCWSLLVFVGRDVGRFPGSRDQQNRKKLAKNGGLLVVLDGDQQ
jgi:hypothetical protein